ncbi:MAG: hypothetical protein JWO63_1710, partial [Frankiales bacterium]|nr:hypothetical protein [Frankiales bacterium]
MVTGRFSPRSPARSRPEQSYREGQVITRLRELPPGPDPDPAFVATLRAQLLQAAQLQAAERASAEVEPARRLIRPDRPIPARRPVRRPVRGPSFALAAAALVLAVLTGLALSIAGSRSTGDSRYHLQLAGDRLELAFTGADVDKGYAYLALASERTTAATRASPGSGQSLSGRQASLLTETLVSTDQDTRTGMRYLGVATSEARSAAPLRQLGPWIDGQRSLLAQLHARLPSGALQARAAVSSLLLDRVSQRFGALSQLAGCACLATSGTDDLGPIPCSPCDPSPAPGGAVVTGAPSSTPSPGGVHTGSAAPSSAPSVGSVPGSNSASAPGPRPTNGVSIAPGTGGISVGVPGAGISVGAPATSAA